MKVAIIETVHYQYGLTLSAIFKEADKVFFVTRDIHDGMHAYDASSCVGEFIIIPDVEEAADLITRTCRQHGVDLLLISPIFKDFTGLYKVVSQLECTKVLTTHNINFWFRSRFRTWKYYKERKLKQAIARRCDYIAVEDFLYEHVTRHDRKLGNQFKFIYIPFTLFKPGREIRFHRQDHSRLQVVLPGSIHWERRRYETVLEVIRNFARQKAPITFSFAGKAIGDYGLHVVRELDKANDTWPGIARFYPPNEPATPEMFLHEMETSDLVLSTSTTRFRALGTTEHIGSTKPTGAIQDMNSFQLPGLLPAHLSVPRNLAGSVFNYTSASDLRDRLQQLLDHPDTLRQWKEKARENSNNFTAEKIREQLPF